ncbi:hypothetical protein B0H19DRAFT_1175408 [Mycena capillaripes]|nr:hypothetical protein B0H19DRAFT_1175408 [Mycena capillaripes]
MAGEEHSIRFDQGQRCGVDRAIWSGKRCGQFLLCIINPAKAGGGSPKKNQVTPGPLHKGGGNNLKMLERREKLGKHMLGASVLQAYGLAHPSRPNLDGQANPRKPGNRKKGGKDSQEGPRILITQRIVDAKTSEREIWILRGRFSASQLVQERNCTAPIQDPYAYAALQIPLRTCIIHAARTAAQRTRPYARPPIVIIEKMHIASRRRTRNDSTRKSRADADADAAEEIQRYDRM